jgi:rSAM/selenodomain-associated transferase 2/rSAM/selenodomain-associated transferase 1
MQQPSVSIVVPVYNEVPNQHDDSFLSRIQGVLTLLRPVDELLLVDGGSSDYSWPTIQTLASHPQISAIQGAKGRALQMNAGAAKARGDVLLFLHADTVLGIEAWQEFLQKLAKHSNAELWGRFDVRISGESKWLPVVAWFMNQRSRLSKIGTGDQGLFVGRELFARMGGFPEQPLMEDIELCKRLKQIAPQQFVAIHKPLVTSGRRWDVQGARKTIVLMWRFRYQYWRGVSAQELARQYADTREKRTQTVAVFAKFPQAGRVKTRLEPLLGAEQCAAFARYLLLSTLDKLQGVDVALWTDGGTDAEWDALLQARQFPGPVQRHVQPAGHLGFRMECAVQTHLKESRVVVLLGPDAVQFSKTDLQQLERAAQNHSMAFVPALDGGYVALACTRCVPAVFSETIRWGTASVAEQTKAALHTQRISAQWFQAQMDIDEPEDLKTAIQHGFVPEDWATRYS